MANASFDSRRPYQLGAHVVPAIWPFLAPEEFQYFTFPEERCATCHACPKVAAEGFHPDIRCCTYHPRMPNFLIGYALQDEATALLMEMMIREGFATPEGLQATPAQFRASLENHAEDRFGKSETVVCRFLDREKRQCRIYPYRNSVCSTFFCLHDNGDTGDEFWMALQNYMGQMETALSQWAMERLGIDPRKYFDQYDSLAEDPYAACQAGKDSWSAETQASLWGSFYGREAQFYKECAALITAHRNSLVTIANENPLLAPHKYDLAFRASLPPSLKQELDAGGGVGGTPVALADLWYELELAHRRLWKLPEAHHLVLWHDSTVVTASGNPRFPWRLEGPAGALHCTDLEKAFLLDCKTPRRITNDWLYSQEDLDTRRLVSQGIALGILTVPVIQ